MNTFDVSFEFVKDYILVELEQYILKDLISIVYNYSIEVPFYVHKWVDCKDLYNKWFEAQIININKELVKVHFKGWKEETDELFCCFIKCNCGHRHIYGNFEKINTHTLPLKETEENFFFQINDKFKVLDSSDKLITGKVIDIKLINKQLMYLIHYIGWDSLYDEWINHDSYRLTYELLL